MIMDSGTISKGSPDNESYESGNKEIVTAYEDRYSLRLRNSESNPMTLHCTAIIEAPLI